MRTIKQFIRNSILKIGFLGLLLLVASCSQDVKLESEIDQGLKASQNSILKTLVKGAPIKGTNGIDVGPDGNLYVASLNNQEILVMDRNNGKIIDRFGPANGVLGPDDMVIGPDGTIYWTDILTGFVGRMTADGQQLGYQFIAPGVNPITFSEDGRLFVALDFLGDGLYELDPNLQEPPRVIIEATEANPFPLGFLNAFEFGDDGYLYGPLFAAGLVVKVDVGNPGDPVSTSPFTDGTVQVVSGGFFNPASAKFSPDGVLHVIDQTGEVFQVDIQTGEKKLIAELEEGLDNIAFDEKGTLFITNNDEGTVVELLPSGKARIISPGGMTFPQGLAVLKGSNNQDALYEADIWRLRQYNGTSGQLESIQKGFLISQGPESLILPMNVSADGDNLVLSSWFSAAVQVWSPSDGVLENYPDAEVPIDAVRVNGEIVVSDLGFGGVVYASDNSLILPLGAASGLATDGETLYAADWASGEIWQLGFDGSDPTVVASGLVNPEGLALDNNGRLLVVETGAKRLTRIDLGTGEMTTIVEDLELFEGGLGAPPTWGFEGVAVGAKGDIYLAGSLNNEILKIPHNKLK